MKTVKVVLEFEVNDDVSEQQVEAYLWDEVAGMTLGDGLTNEVRKSLGDTVFQGDNFDVSSVTFK